MSPCQRMTRSSATGCSCSMSGVVVSGVVAIACSKQSTRETVQAPHYAEGATAAGGRRRGPGSDAGTAVYAAKGTAACASARARAAATSSSTVSASWARTPSSTSRPSAKQRVRVATRDLRLLHSGADRGEHLAELGLGPDGAERPGRGAHYRRGLVAKGVGRNRARDPVQGILELPGDGGVVLGGGDEHGVGVGDGGAELRDRRRRLIRVVVLVVGRHRLQALPESPARRRRGGARRRPGAGWCCRSPGGGCRRCRGFSSR